MTTIDVLAVGWRAAREANRQARADRRAQAARGAVTRLGAWRRPLLTVAGLGSATAAAWTVSMGVGLLVTGAACFLFEWLTNE